MKRSSRLQFLALLILAAGAGLGCVNLSKAPPEINYYVLEVERDAETRSAQSAIPYLAIPEFYVSEAASRTSFLLRVDDFQVREDYYNRWLAAPDRLVAETVREWITESGVSRRCGRTSTRLDPSFVLQGNLQSVEVDAREAPVATIHIHFLLLKQVDDAATEVLLNKRYESSQPVGALRPMEIAAAWNQAMTKICSELEADLAASLENEG